MVFSPPIPPPPAKPSFYLQVSLDQIRIACFSLVSPRRAATLVLRRNVDTLLAENRPKANSSTTLAKVAPSLPHFTTLPAPLSSFSYVLPFDCFRESRLARCCFPQGLLRARFANKFTRSSFPSSASSNMFVFLIESNSTKYYVGTTQRTLLVSAFCKWW